jgi:hypothetical protein
MCAARTAAWRYCCILTSARCRVRLLRSQPSGAHWMPPWQLLLCMRPALQQQQTRASMQAQQVMMGMSNWQLALMMRALAAVLTAQHQPQLLPLQLLPSLQQQQQRAVLPRLPPATRSGGLCGRWS